MAVTTAPPYGVVLLILFAPCNDPWGFQAISMHCIWQTVFKSLHTHLLCGQPNRSWHQNHYLLQSFAIGVMHVAGCLATVANLQAQRSLLLRHREGLASF